MINRAVAIKLLTLGDPGAKETRERREWVLREARTAGVLTHPNIVTVHDIGEQGEYAYIVMELVQGANLGVRMAGEGPLARSEVFRILRETAAALDFAHGQGIFHRDVKPGNILIQEDGAVKLVDFGLAKFETGTKLTQTGALLGTPQYMSPEQIHGIAISGRSDQFSLAIVAYELLTGQAPFEGDSLVFQLLQQDPPPVRTHNPELHEDLNGVLLRALAKKAEDRYVTCSDFVTDLELAADGQLSVSASQGRQATASAARPKRWLLPALGAVVAAVAIGFFFSAGEDAGKAPPAPTVDAVVTEAISETPPDDPSPAALEPKQNPPARQPAATAPPPPPPKREPERATAIVTTTASEALTGTVVWFGALGPNEEVSIDGAQSTIGQVTRGLPGKPVAIRLTPRSLEVVESPSPENGWRRLRVRNGARQIDTFIATYTLIESREDK